MAKTYEVNVAADARELHELLSRKMSHIEKVSEDVFVGEGYYLAVIFYEQYFMRAGNQASLLVMIESTGDTQARLKSVSCGTSKGILFKFDWGAADAFAHEPIRHAQEVYPVSGHSG
jgi:hypothetical protein